MLRHHSSTPIHEYGTGEVKRNNKRYPHYLNFYDIPPTDNISIEEFEKFALDRLQVLKALEAATLRRKPENEVKEHLQELSKQYLPMHSNDSERAYPLEEERRKDHVSHFILRLAYCRSEELRSWFLRYEYILFKLRYLTVAVKERQEFLSHQNLTWKTLSRSDREVMKADLQAVSPHINVDTETFFEVEFEKVLDMVARRSVYLRGGTAYVPMSDQATLVMDEFKNRLAKALEITAKEFPKLDEDDRIMPILNNVNRYYLGNSFANSTKVTGNITAFDVDKLVEHFPLCMRHLHRKLRDDKHLKHYGRMQYNLFLKGIGLPLEEALVFWRKSFSKYTDEQFQKNYAYNVRHNYGMEGKRVNYTPYNKIINNNQPGPGEHHGCPFRHFSEESLRVTFASVGVRNEAYVREIINLVRNKHYQVACTRYYEITRGGERGMMDTIEHPNHFFEQSYKLSIKQ
ncbi:9260_t:CDS:10, partial [Paraglomus brasilianum]